MKDYPVLSKYAQYNHENPDSGRGRQKKANQGGSSIRRTWFNITGFED